MWETIFDKMVSRLIRTGELRVTCPDGRTRQYGPGGAPSVHITITDNATLRALCLRPELALGEAYMDGRVKIDGDDPEDLVRLLLNSWQQHDFPLWIRATERVRFALRDIYLRNTADSARANVAHHYDISDDFYRLFLDDDMQYSCAYFAHPGIDLDAAQAAKKAHIAAKLRLEPGMRVLDIGCGWGGMALTLAQDYGVHVTGATLSQNQFDTARARAAESGLSAQTDFRLVDYRMLDESFDRIVSVGMLEHVGAPQYGVYFDKVAELLAPDGIALIHTIGRCAPPAAPSQWIDKYIFPGGYIPSLSELAVPIERNRLWYSDIEIWRLHYAMTLRHWRDRFESHLDTVRAMYDDRFIRMWRYYLTTSMLVFEIGPQAVFHLQLAHQRDAVPLTRDYLYRGDGAGLMREAAE